MYIQSELNNICFCHRFLIRIYLGNSLYFGGSLKEHVTLQHD